MTDTPFKQHPAQPMAGSKPLIQTSAQFIAGFVPPDYLLDGVIQRRFIYSLTGATGAGKTAFLLLLSAHTALGRKLGGRHIERGRVIYFAGENPDDVRMRWIVMAEKLNFNAEAIDVCFVPGVYNLAGIEKRITDEARKMGGFSLAIVDTSAAFFHGNSENENVEMGKHARQLRRLTTLPGAPAVIVACHPVKNASNDNLLPRGGGAFVAEVDGNLVAQKRDTIVDLHWQGKFRGPDFDPIAFQLETVTSHRLKDSRGKMIPTIMVRPLSDADRSSLHADDRSREDKILLLLDKGPQTSIGNIAISLGWINDKGDTQKSIAQRALDKLRKDGLVTNERDRWVLKDKGKKEVKQLKEMD